MEHIYFANIPELHASAVLIPSTILQMWVNKCMLPRVIRSYVPSSGENCPEFRCHYVSQEPSSPIYLSPRGISSGLQQPTTNSQVCDDEAREISLNNYQDKLFSTFHILPAKLYSNLLGIFSLCLYS